MSFPSPAVSASSNATIEAILQRRFPSTIVRQGIVAITRALGGKEASVLEEHMAMIQAERERLQRLPPDELSRMLQALNAEAKAAEAAQQAEKQRKAQAKEAAKEAAKFYNLSAAVADYDFWTKADFWTFDEALALLMGKEPKVVTWSAVKQELEARALFESGRPQPTFLQNYQRLRALAQRADTMIRTARLRPGDVIAWADRVGVVAVPARLRPRALPSKDGTSQVNIEPAAVDAGSTGTASPADASRLAPSTATLKRAALVAKYEGEWPTVDSDLRHGNENGLSEAARAETHGHWHEEAAVQWAKRHGKMRDPRPSQLPQVDQLTRHVYRMKD